MGTMALRPQLEHQIRVGDVRIFTANNGRAKIQTGKHGPSRNLTSAEINKIIELQTSPDDLQAFVGQRLQQAFTYNA